MLLFKYFKIRTAYFKPMVSLMIMLLALTFISQETMAKKKKVHDNEAVSSLTSCMLADDATHKVLKDGSYSCCSKSEGICIWCPKNPAKACVLNPDITAQPGETSPFKTVINPAFFNDLTDDASTDETTMSPLKNFILRNKGESVEAEKYESSK